MKTWANYLKHVWLIVDLVEVSSVASKIENEKKNRERKKETMKN